MLRQLPHNVTADKSPDWLPAGWIAQSSVLKSGREIRSYTHLGSGQKFSTKDHVLQHIDMEKIREIRYSEGKSAKVRCRATMEGDNITERGSHGNTQPSSPTRKRKLKARAARRQLFSEEDLHNVVVELDDPMKEVSDAPGIKVNSEYQNLSVSICVGIDFCPEMDLNESVAEEIDARNIEIASTGMNNKKDDILIEESERKNKEPLKMQEHEEQHRQEGVISESNQSLFFPFKNPPTDADHALVSDSCIQKKIKAKDPQNEHLDPYNIECHKMGTSGGEGSSRNSRRSERHQLDHCLGLCPEFVFEPVNNSSRTEDDTIIRKHLEERASDNDRSLLDFGLPSFAAIEISPSL